MSLASNEWSVSPLPLDDGKAASASIRNRRALASVDPAPAGPIVGRLVGLASTGEPLVDFPENRSGRPQPARSTVVLDAASVGAEVLLLFERGDLSRPLVTGVLQPVKPSAAAVEVDGERVVFTAEKEIVFRCGEASITLTRAGKVLIKGAYLLSRSSGVNRIKGGSVQIN